MARRAKEEKEQLDQVRWRIAGESPQQAAVKPFTVALSRAQDTKPSLSNLLPVKLAAAKVCVIALKALRSGVSSEQSKGIGHSAGRHLPGCTGFHCLSKHHFLATKGFPGSIHQAGCGQ